VGANKGEEMSLRKEMGEVLSAQRKEMKERLSAQGKEVGEIKSNLAALSAQMAVMMEEVKKSCVSGYRAPSRSPSPRGEDRHGCYQWGNGAFQEAVPKIFGIAERGKTSILTGN